MITGRFASGRTRAAGVLATARAWSVPQLVVVAGLAASASSGLTLLQALYGGTRGAPQRAAIVALSRIALVAGLTWTAVSLAWARRRYGRFWPPAIGVGGGRVMARALLWSAIGWLVLMIYPPALALSRNPFRGVVWITWDLQDYRWLLATWLVTIVAAVALPPLASRWLEGRREIAAPPPAPTRAGRTIVAAIAGAALAAVLFAPPWNIERLSGEVGNHDVHLSQLQAIRTGTLPYVGPASIQYGPGSQLLQYAYMTGAGRFSLLGYRESYALAFLIGLAIFAATSMAWLGIRYGALASLLALYVSPFALFGWSGPSFTGFFGWGNPFRYLGTFVVVGAMPFVLPRTRGLRNMPAFAVGLAWGAFTWMSQENLATTALAAGLFFVVAWALGACSIRQVLGAVVNGVAGWAVFWLPILLYYAGHGEARRFVEGYFLISRFVAAGMSNTAWDPVANRGWTAAFYLTPLFLFFAAWVAIIDWPGRRFAVPLPADRQRLVALVCVSLVCFTGALFRKDSSHFVNVLVALPAVIAALAAHLVAPWRRPGARLLLLAAPVALIAQFPAASRIAQFPREFVIEPASRFARARELPASPWSRERGVAFERAGAYVDDHYAIYEHSMPARSFFESMNEIRALVGDAPAYVQSFPEAPPEIVYFFADLTPGPILFNVWTMVFHTGIQERFLQHFAAHCTRFGAVIGVDPGAPEVAIFKGCHPNVVQIPKSAGGHPFFVWLGDPR